MEPQPDRRRFLGMLALGLAGVLAGCSAERATTAQALAAGPAPAAPPAPPPVPPLPPVPPPRPGPSQAVHHGPTAGRRIALTVDDGTEAIGAFERDIVFCAEFGNSYGQAHTLANLGQLHAALDDPQRARRAWTDAAGLLTASGAEDDAARLRRCPNANAGPIICDKLPFPGTSPTRRTGIPVGRRINER
jgi:hypothetical protein